VGKLGFNIRMLGSKVTPKIHAPFDCRMRQNSPMTIYNVKKIFASGGLSSKGG